MSGSKYSYLKKMISDHLKGLSQLSEEEIMRKIDMAFERNEINSREYDKLMSSL